MANGVVLPKIKLVNSPNQSTRTSPINLVVLHDTEGGYEGAVSWFKNPHAQVSAHVVVKEDGSEATQMVPYSKKAWHVAAFNSRSIGIELAGYFNHESAEQLAVAARIVAFFLHKYKLPCKASSSVGYCRHKDLGEAGGGHHDPFDDATWKKFQKLVEAEYKRGGFRKTWGVD